MRWEPTLILSAWMVAACTGSKPAADDATTHSVSEPDDELPAPLENDRAHGAPSTAVVRVGGTLMAGATPLRVPKLAGALGVTVTVRGEHDGTFEVETLGPAQGCSGHLSGIDAFRLRFTVERHDLLMVVTDPVHGTSSELAPGVPLKASLPGACKAVATTSHRQVLGMMNKTEGFWSGPSRPEQVDRADQAAYLKYVGAPALAEGTTIYWADGTLAGETAAQLWVDDDGVEIDGRRCRDYPLVHGGPAALTLCYDPASVTIARALDYESKRRPAGHGPPPRVRLKKLVVDGPLPEEHLRPFMRFGRIDQLRGCRWAVDAAERRPKGRVEIAFSVDEEGDAIDAEVVETTLDSERFGECMAETIEGWEFPRSPAGIVDVRATYVVAP